MAMESDTKIQQYVLLGKSARGKSIAELITRALAEPGLFGFGEILDLPSVQETLADLKVCHAAHQSSLPALTPQQTLKLKQLTVMSLAMKHKVIPYDTLMQQLDIPTVRELEDFIITECFYSNILQGKLDQRQRCLQVHSTSSRDIKLQQLPELSSALAGWLQTSQLLMRSIEDNMQHAAEASADIKRRKDDIESKQEDMKKTLKTEMDLRSQEGVMLDDASFDYMEEDRTSTRPKRCVWSVYSSSSSSSQHKAITHCGGGRGALVGMGLCCS
eukprot:jgi/Chrzof1/5861/Cz16g18140.t1